MSSASTTARVLATLGRGLFGGVLAFMGLNSFQGMEGQIEYADSKEVPMPEFLVPFSHGMLALGGLGIALWRRPVLSAGAVVTFFAGVTPQMHDFWNFEGDQKQGEMINFLKNTALFGAALAFLATGKER